MVSCILMSLSSHALMRASNGLMKGEPLIVCVLTIWSSRLVCISSTEVKMDTPEGGRRERERNTVKLQIATVWIMHRNFPTEHFFARVAVFLHPSLPVSL